MSEDKHATMLRELLEEESGRLSGWEIDFIENLSRFDNLTGDQLSERQQAKLEQIWDKVFNT